MKEKLLLSKLFPAFLCFRPPVPPCPVQSRYCLLSAALSPTDWRLADSWARLRPRTTLSLTRSHLSSPPTSRLPLLTALCQLGRLSSLHMTHHVTSLPITGESQVTAQCSVFTKTISSLPPTPRHGRLQSNPQLSSDIFHCITADIPTYTFILSIIVCVSDCEHIHNNHYLCPSYLSSSLNISNNCWRVSIRFI